MLKKLLFLGCFLNLFSSLHAQTTLSPGDIAIIGTTYDVLPYEMSIVNLVPMSAGTVIRITDYGYDEATGTFGITSATNTAEGSITWTLTSAMPAGTVTKFSITGGATPTVSGLPGVVSVTGWTFATPASCPIPAGGDNWFIFQGSSPTSVSQFVFGWVNTFGVTFNGVNQPAGQFLVPGSGLQPNNGNSYLPPSLTLGSTAIALNRDPASGGYHGDNNVYTGIKSGTKSAILAAICLNTGDRNTDNWLSDEFTIYDINPGGAYFPGTNPIFTVLTPCALSLTAASQTNVSCNGGSNGTATVSPSGGTPVYTYSWAPSGGTAATATGLSAGTYTVTVTDANLCTATRNFTITQPTAISVSTGSLTNVSCNGGSNGTATVSPSGGTPGYTYSWAPSGGTAATASGLSAGTYTVTVTDANSCTATRNFTITQPTSISTATAAQTNVSCNGGSNGSASVTPSGGAGGYTYSWSPSGGTAATATGLSAGTYTVTVTDANSCTATRNFTITQPVAVDASVTLTSGILLATQTGATYQWYQCPNTLLTGEINQTFTPTVVGDYKVEITLGGCTNTSSCVTVTTLETTSFDSTNFVYYPNPTSDILHITNGNLIEEVNVINLMGQQMISTKFNSKEIQLNLSTLPTGTYFITLNSEGKSKTIKILKQ